MAKRKGASTSGPRARRRAAEEEREEREAENAQRLDKLPPEVWERILDELENDDLFPLALSCKYFRQKQKELVARTRQKGKSRLALKTTLHHWPVKDQPASADYLQFCYKEIVSRDYVCYRDKRIRRMTAYRGHLPLLQELLKPLKKLDLYITGYAGQYFSPHCFLLRFGF